MADSSLRNSRKGYFWYTSKDGVSFSSALDPDTANDFNTAMNSLRDVVKNVPGEVTWSFWIKYPEIDHDIENEME